MAHEPGSGPARLLVVDDEHGVLRALERFLERLGYEVRSAASVAEAREHLALREFDVVITDLQMPGETGLDLLRELQVRSPETRRILISGKADTSDAAEAIERGVDRLLLKPFGLEELEAAVEIAISQRRSRQRFAREREVMEAIVRQRDTTSRIWVLRAAHALATAVEAKDAYTAGHAARVTAYALRLAEDLGNIEIGPFRLAAQLHDVGKIGVPDRVLNKPAPLHESELELVRQHTLIGVKILDPFIDDRTVIAVVRSHHERWDGGGYPDGLAGEDIPRLARVLAVADALDAMTSSRAYRDRMSWDAAVAEIRGAAGTQFDPVVVAAFERIEPTLRSLHDFLHSPAV